MAARSLNQMGLWIDILKLCAGGDQQKARELLALELNLALRDFSPSPQGSRLYTGPVPQAVARFINTLPEAEKPFASSLANDLVDYIVDDVIASVEGSLILIELCRKRPQATLEDMVNLFPWDAGLKRDPSWKRRRIADLLRSMLELEISLPETVLSMLGDEGEAVYEFNETAYAAAPRRLARSWQDFKRQHEIDSRFLSVVDSEAEANPDSEGFDYGSITVARLILNSGTALDDETILDFRLLGEDLSPELTEIMEQMHEAKPKDGYRPVAWHSVFWSISSDYEALHLDLRLRDPFCETDQELADHISDNYRDVVSISRPVILRRRKRLYESCDERVRCRLRERFVGGPEQKSSGITHVVEEV
jgi:hypothetical protein